MRRVTVPQDTGSIGVNRLDLIARGVGEFKGVALTGGHNTELLARQMRARQVAAGHAGAAFNAAKEVAPDHFIAGGSGFPAKAAVVAATMARIAAENGLGNAPVSLDTVAEMDHLARIRAAEVIASGKGSV